MGCGLILFQLINPGLELQDKFAQSLHLRVVRRCGLCLAANSRPEKRRCSDEKSQFSSLRYVAIRFRIVELNHVSILLGGRRRSHKKERIAALLLVAQIAANAAKAPAEKRQSRQ